MIVHVVSHTVTTPDEDEDRLIAICRDAQTAEHARATLMAEPGFRDHPDGFVIDATTLDRDEWREGFAWRDGEGTVEEPVLDIVDVDASPDVFVVEHRRITGRHEQVCLIGIFSTRDAAMAAILRASKRPGFRSFPDGFVAYGIALDVVHWPNGFDAREAASQRLLSRTVSSLPVAVR